MVISLMLWEDEVRMQGFGAYGHVIPEQVVIIELGL
jgi:hypothetical protein